MRLIDIFFKLYGMKRILKFKSKSKNPQINLKQIVDELNQLDKDIKLESNSSKCYKFIIQSIPYSISLLYSIFVCLLLLWPFAYAIALTAIHHKSEYILTQLFTLVYVAQFITGYVYYNSKGYKKMIKRNRKYKNKMIVLHILGFIISFLLAVLITLLIAFEIKIDIYNSTVQNASIVSKVFFYLLVFMTLLYSYNIFIANLIIFSTILTIHCLELGTYEKNFISYVMDYRNEITLMSIIQDYNHLKNINNRSINNLNNMFSSMTIIGGVSVYFLILLYAAKKYSVSYYVDIAIYAIVEIIYFSTIYFLKNHVQNIVSLGRSLKFMNRFLSKTKFYNFAGEEIERINNDLVTLENISGNLKTIGDINTRTMIRTLENTNSLDWLILNSIFKEKWEHFELFGFDINDATLIKKILAIIILYIFTSQTNSYWNVELSQ